MNEIDQALAILATQQHDVFSRRQARAAGLSASALCRRIQSRTYIECGPQALQFTGVSLTYRGELMAGLLDIDRTSALVSGRAAATLLELDGFHERPLEFLVERPDRHRGTVGTVRSIDAVQRLDRVVLDGLPCTSATMTVAQIVATATDEEAGNALDSACRKRLTAVPVVRRRFHALGSAGRAGVARFERVVKAAVVEGWLERQFVALLRSAGLPLPISQQRHALEGVGVVRVDFEFGILPVVIEVAGRRGYMSFDERQQNERRRNALQLAGKTVYSFTRRDVVGDPTDVISTVARALGWRWGEVGTRYALRRAATAPGRAAATSGGTVATSDRSSTDGFGSCSSPSIRAGFQAVWTMHWKRAP